jgi:hypothetical protein
MVSAAIGAVGVIVAAALTGLLVKGGEKVVGKVEASLTGPATVTFKTDSGPVVATSIQQGMGCVGNGWVYPSDSPAAEGARPGDGVKVGKHTWDEDPGAFGAVVASPIILSITMTGPTDHAIIIKDLKFKVLDRQPIITPQHVHLNMFGDCGTGITTQYGMVDLDSEAPYWVDASDWPQEYRPGGRTRLEPLRFPYRLHANDPEDFEVIVYTRKCVCTWSAEIRWVDGSKTGTTVVAGDKDAPFRLAGTEGMRRILWTDQGQNSVKLDSNDATGCRPVSAARCDKEDTAAEPAGDFQGDFKEGSSELEQDDPSGEPATAVSTPEPG